VPAGLAAEQEPTAPVTPRTVSSSALDGPIGSVRLLSAEPAEEPLSCLAARVAVSDRSLAWCRPEPPLAPVRLSVLPLTPPSRPPTRPPTPWSTVSPSAFVVPETVLPRPSSTGPTTGSGSALPSDLTVPPSASPVPVTVLPSALVVPVPTAPTTPMVLSSVPPRAGWCR